MGTHLAAFKKSIDSAVLVSLDTIVDDVLTRPAADRFQVPPDYNSIAWAAALGVNVTRAQIVSPTLEVKRMSLDIIPHERGGIIFSLESPRVLVPKVDLVLTPTENFQIFGSEDGAGATVVAALVALKAPGALPAMPSGDIRLVRATAAVTLVVDTWTTLTPVFEKDLEPGTYVLVGFIPQSTNLIAARVMFPGGTYRPGVPGAAGANAVALDHGADFYDKLMWYAMGTFTHVSPPQFQFLSTVADTSEVIILYVIKVG